MGGFYQTVEKELINNPSQTLPENRRGGNTHIL